MLSPLARRRLNKAAVIAFVGIQLGLPAAFLLDRWVTQGPAPRFEYTFSWQMFSAVDIGSYTGVTHSGEDIELDLEGLPPIVRAVSYTDTTPRMLCARDPYLKEVVRRDAATALEGHEGVFTC